MREHWKKKPHSGQTVSRSVGRTCSCVLSILFLTLKTLLAVSLSSHSILGRFSSPGYVAGVLPLNSAWQPWSLARDSGSDERPWGRSLGGWGAGCCCCRKSYAAPRSPCSWSLPVWDHRVNKSSVGSSGAADIRATRRAKVRVGLKRAASAADRCCCCALASRLRIVSVVFWQLYSNKTTLCVNKKLDI